jgi:hypothetical protein
MRSAFHGSDAFLTIISIVLADAEKWSERCTYLLLPARPSVLLFHRFQSFS